MGKALRKIIIPVVVMTALFFGGINALFGADISANTTFTLDDYSVGAESQFDLQFRTSGVGTTIDQIVIDFSQFGTGNNDFDLSNLSTNAADYNYEFFDTDPTTVTIDNSLKIISFTGAAINIPNGNTQRIYFTKTGSHFLRNDTDVQTNAIPVWLVSCFQGQRMGCRVEAGPAIVHKGDVRIAVEV